MPDLFSHVKKSATHFFFGTFLSRISGFFRDMVLAFYFGSSPKMASFMVAFRFAMLFRRLFGESSLQSTFVPHYEALRMQGLKKAQFFFRDLLLSLFGFLLVVVLAIEGVLHFCSSFTCQDVLEIIQWTEIMLPALIFICLFALSAALLQCFQKFFLASFAPAIFNFVWIIMAFWQFQKNGGKTFELLALGVVLGTFLQWMIIAKKSFSLGLYDLTFKEFFSFRKNFSYFLSKSFIHSFFLSILGIGASQLNSGIDAIFAKMVDPSGPAFLWYAIRIYQVPLALLGISIVSASLPLLSRLIYEEKKHDVSLLFQKLTTRTLGLTIPASFAIFVLGGAGLNLLYGRGSFDHHSLLESTYCLWGYGLGLFPAALVFVLSSCFYAQKNFKTPLRATLWTIGLNIVLNILCIFVFFEKKCPTYAIALATSVSSFFNMFYLTFFLKKIPLGFFENFSIKKSAIKVAFISCVASIFALFLGDLFFADVTMKIVLGYPAFFSKHLAMQLAAAFGMTAGFVSVLVGLAKFLKAEEILDFFVHAKKKPINSFEPETRRSTED